MTRMHSLCLAMAVVFLGQLFPAQLSAGLWDWLTPKSKSQAKDSRPAVVQISGSAYEESAAAKPPQASSPAKAPAVSAPAAIETPADSTMVYALPADQFADDEYVSDENCGSYRWKISHFLRRSPNLAYTSKPSSPYRYYFPGEPPEYYQMNHVPAWRTVDYGFYQTCWRKMDTLCDECEPAEAYLPPVPSPPALRTPAAPAPVQKRQPPAPKPVETKTDQTTAPAEPSAPVVPNIVQPVLPPDAGK